MDVVAPQSWAEAGLETSAPRDRAPLLAIWAAIAERYAAAQASSVGAMGRADMFEGAMPAQAQIFPEHGFGAPYSDIVRAIRCLQEAFFNPFVPYANFGWLFTGSSTGGVKYPDKLASRFMPPNGSKIQNPEDYGFFPYDAFVRIPPVPHPAPGDSTVAATTRAFYAWCRRSLDEMTTICVSEAFHASAYWAASGDSFETAEELAAAATRQSTGGIGYQVSYAGGFYDAEDDLYWYEISVPDGFYVYNRSILAADVRLVASANAWPGGGWRTDSVYADSVFDPFGAPGTSTVPGISARIVRAEAEAWTELVPRTESCPTPIARPPGVPGSSIPDASGCRYWNIGCRYTALFDFTPSFRFKAGA